MLIFMYKYNYFERGSCAYYEDLCSMCFVLKFEAYLMGHVLCGGSTGVSVGKMSVKERASCVVEQ
jgi:hypothetical protein